MPPSVDGRRKHLISLRCTANICLYERVFENLLGTNERTDERANECTGSLRENSF